MRWLTLRCAVALLASCGSPRPPPTPSPAPVVTQPPVDAAPIVGISVVVTPPDAEVHIDDDDVGKASELATVVPLKVGLHQIVITLDGYNTFRAEFTVSDKTERFVVRLEAKH